MNIIKSIAQSIQLEKKLFTRKEARLFWLYIALYALMAINVLPKDIILLVITSLFVLSSTRLCFFMFVFYTLWDEVSVFSFGITCSLIFSCVLLGKILFLDRQFKKLIHHKLFAISFLWMIYILIYGVFSHLSGNGFTGINIFFKSVFLIYALLFINNEESSYVFWKTIFQITAISVLLTVIYGHFYGTALDRWISGLDDNIGSQIYGTLGTTRTGIFTVISIVYSLYFIKNRTLKIAFSFLYSAITLMTISLTAFSLMIIIYIIYFYHIGYLKMRNIVLFLLVLSTSLYISYPFISQIDVVKPVLARVENAVEAFSTGDVNKATSGREDLASIYINEFSSYPFCYQLLGVTRTAAVGSVGGNDMNSHNSYIDMLFYYGILGIFFLIFTSLYKLSYYRMNKCFYPILSLKLIILLAAFSVSVFSSPYFIFYSLI